MTIVYIDHHGRKAMYSELSLTEDDICFIKNRYRILEILSDDDPRAALKVIKSESTPATPRLPYEPLIPFTV